MYIDANSIIKGAALIAAFGTIVGAIIAIYNVIENNKQQNKIIKTMQDEQTLIVYGLRGALQGLIEQGCNGPCKDALDKLDKHINKAAHDTDL